MPRAKTGGRTKGTPNRSTKQVKDFLGRVFERAFKETRTYRREVNGEETVVELGLEELLVEQIVTLQIDPKLFVVLLAHYAGTPAKQVEHNHRGTVNLARLIAKAGDPDDDVDDDAEADE